VQNWKQTGKPKFRGGFCQIPKVGTGGRQSKFKVRYVFFQSWDTGERTTRVPKQYHPLSGGEWAPGEGTGVNERFNHQSLPGITGDCFSCRLSYAIDAVFRSFRGATSRLSHIASSVVLTPTTVISTPTEIGTSMILTI